MSYEIPRAKSSRNEMQSNCNLVVLGTKGFGKTTWVEQVALAKQPRILIIDTMLKDYTEGEIVTSVGELARKLAQAGDLAKFRYILRAPGKELDALELIRYNKALKRAPIIRTTVVLEEVTNYCDPTFIPDVLKDHLMYGRHSENNLIATARSPYEVSRHLTRQADLLVSFRQNEDRDIQFLATINKKAAAQLRTLERFRPLLIRGTPEELKAFLEGK